MFESLDDKNALISRVQRYFAKQDIVTQLNIPRPITQKQSPIAPPVNAVVPKRSGINFIDTRIKPNSNSNNDNITTKQGAAVLSVDLHRMLLSSWSIDLQERLDLYKQIDQIIYTCTEAYQTEKELIDLAFGNKGYTSKVDISDSAKKLIKVNPQLVKKAERMAASVDPLWEALEDRQTIKKKKARARCYTRYGNVPIELIDTNNGIVGYRGQPPHAMKINCDEDLEFAPNQLDAYIKHDAFNIARILAKWPQSLIVWCGNFELEWLIYGVPPMLSGLAYYRGLLRGTSVLPDAREWSMPQIVEAYGDIANNPIDPTNLTEVLHNTREERKRRGESLNGYEHNIRNGFLKDIKMLSASTDYLDKLTDIKMYSSSVAALFGMNLARRITPEEVTRATADKIDEYVHEHADTFLHDFTESTDKEVFNRYIDELNRATSEQRSIAGFTDQEKYIDKRLITLTITSSSPTTAERMTERANTAIAAYNNGQGVLPIELAAEVVCQALNIDYDKCLMLLAKRKQQQISEQPNISTQQTQPNNDLLSTLDPQNQSELDNYLQ